MVNRAKTARDGNWALVAVALALVGLEFRNRMPGAISAVAAMPLAKLCLAVIGTRGDAAGGEPSGIIVSLFR